MAAAGVEFLREVFGWIAAVLVEQSGSRRPSVAGVPSFCGAICRCFGGVAVPGSGFCVVVVAVFGGMPGVFLVVLSVFRGLFRVGVKIFLFVNQ